MAATGLQMNWSGVQFTPAGGSPVVIDRITSLTVTRGASLATFAGDNARYNQVVVNNMNAPRITLTSGNVGLLFGATLPPGISGILEANQLDAEAATGGDIDWAMGNGTTSGCVVEGPDNTGAFSAYASGSMSFMGFSQDGSTNPLTFTRA